jgi:hypothetical protein
MAPVGYTLAGVRYDEGMRLVPGFLFAGFAGLVGMIALACGGASDQDVLSASSSGAASGSSSGATTSSSGATASSSGTTTSGSSSGGTTTTDAGKPPPTGTCEPETEPNDEPNDANELKASLCGSLPLATDEFDFATWQLDSNAKTMDFTFQGNVKIRIFAEGFDPVELSPSSNPPIPFAAGKRYLARISAAETAVKVDWRINLAVTTK